MTFNDILLLLLLLFICHLCHMNKLIEFDLAYKKLFSLHILTHTLEENEKNKNKKNFKFQVFIFFITKLP